MPITHRTYDYATNKETIIPNAFVGQVISIYSKDLTDLDGWHRETIRVACVWADGRFSEVPVVDAGPSVNCADLTEDNRQEYLQALWTARFEDRVKNLTRDSAAAAQRFVRGDRVVVVRGTKVAKGTAGTVVGFTKPNSFGVVKAGVATTDRTEKVVFGSKSYDKHLDVVWVDQKNVEKEGWRDAVASKEEIEADAAANADEFIAYMEAQMAHEKWPVTRAPNPAEAHRLSVYR